MDAALRHLAERGHERVTAQVLRRSERPNRAYVNMGGRIHRSFWQNHLYVIPCRAGT